MTQDEIIRAIDALNRVYCSYMHNKQNDEAKKVSVKMLALVEQLK